MRENFTDPWWQQNCSKSITSFYPRLLLMPLISFEGIAQSTTIMDGCRQS